MKGISPMIAIILLIAFTVAVAGIISVWLTGFTRTTTSTVEAGTEAQIKCAASTLVIKEVKYNATAPRNDTQYHVNVTVTYETGTEYLFNLTIEVSGKGVTNSSTTAYTSTSDPFEPGESHAESINVTNALQIIPPEYVRARAYCQGSIGIVGECKSGQTCMKAVT